MAIVELGLGTGCVTRELLRRMRPDARLVSLDINPRFVDQCRIRDPRLTLRLACATDLRSVLEAEGLGAVDVVISSLPLAIMGDDAVDRILAASKAVLRPEGRFVQFQYSLSRGARLRAHYARVAVDVAFFNVPPAFVYTCSKQPGRSRIARSRWSLASAYMGALAAAGLIARFFREL